MKKLKVNLGNNEYHVGVEELGDGSLKIALDGKEHIVSVSDICEERSEERKAHDFFEHQKTIRSPMPGTVSQILVKVGDEVRKNTVLLTLLAMKMENDILAPMPAKVKEINVSCNDAVEADQELIVLE